MLNICTFYLYLFCAETFLRTFTLRVVEFGMRISLVVARRSMQHTKTEWSQSKKECFETDVRLFSSVHCLKVDEYLHFPRKKNQRRIFIQQEKTKVHEWIECSAILPFHSHNLKTGQTNNRFVAAFFSNVLFQSFFFNLTHTQCSQE